MKESEMLDFAADLFSRPADSVLAEIASPRWGLKTSRDWKAFVPCHFRDRWDELGTESRLAIFSMAVVFANRFDVD